MIKGSFRKTIFICLFAIVVLGILLRLHALSPFNIYPDSYQSLIVAKNIATYQSVLGFLGPQGMIYPDFFSWTRPGYPLLILFGTFLTNDLTQSARLLSFICGVIAIPLTFFFIRTLFRSALTGIFGAGLVALSFHHIVWGGFIMTETVGVFFVLLFLWRFLSAVQKKRESFVFEDFQSGILLAFAVLIRYEYIVLFFPITLLFFLTQKQPLRRMLHIGIAFTFVFFVTTLNLFPLESLDKIIIEQLRDFWPFVLTGFILLPFIVFLTKRFLKKITNGLIVSIGILIVVSFLSGSFLGLRAFLLYDFLLFSCFFVGILLLRKQQPIVAFFILVAITLLGVVYYRVNPTMDRYLTHLIPFLVVPASLGCKQIFLMQKVNKNRLILHTVVILFIIMQLLISYYGLRYLHDDSWFSISYEEKAARLLQNKIPDNTVLLTSQPEPYFYYIGISTHSIADRYPFLFNLKLVHNQTIIIIEDMGTHVYFPEFTKFLHEYMTKNKIATYRVGEKYHIENLSQKEITLITIYETTFEELQTKIRQIKDN